MDRTPDLVLRPIDDHHPWELAPHVVARLGGAVRRLSRRMDAPRAAHGMAIVGATLNGRAVNVLCGLDDGSGHLAVRVHVPSVAGARVAAVTFPVVLLLILLVAHQMGGTAALPGAFVGGGVTAFLASWAAFVLARRIGGGHGDDAHASAVLARLEPALRESLEPLGVELQRGTARLCGIDTGFGAQAPEAPADERAWTALMKEALESVA
jgi:hypothetical protein